MSYLRVIPRDLFNEGNFLKCWGQIALLTMDSEEIEIFHDDKAFRLEQDEDGWLYAKNLVLLIHKKSFMVTRPINSRDPWPVYLVDGREHNICVQIFDTDDDTGEAFFSDKFLNFIQERKP